MTAQLIWGIASAPALFAALALFASLQPGQRPLALRKFAKLVSIFAAILGFASAILVFAEGDQSVSLVTIEPLSLSLMLDRLSVSLAFMVCLVGTICISFSCRYLDGDQDQGRFLGWMSATLGSVLLLILSGSMTTLLIGWVATSLALHQLLLFYRDRPEARRVAHKKFVFARLGDVALGFAAILLIWTAGTDDISAIGAVAADHQAVAALAALCLAFAALLKSAQFPTHGWLLEVMETPTPVSALLHAGIVNAGGFLLLRMSDVLITSPAVLLLLVVVGGVTALVGTLAMLTQTSIKSALAWSTVGQMGFMIMQCGFGAFTAALLHILGHSAYKAYAFLSSGGVIDRARQTRFIRMDQSSGIARTALLLTMAVSAGAFTLWLAGPQLLSKAGFIPLVAILTIGLGHWFAQSSVRQHMFLALPLIFILSIGVCAVYLAIQSAGLVGYPDLAANIPQTGTVQTVFEMMTIIAFFTAALIALHISTINNTAVGKTLYLGLRRGFYIGQKLEKWLGIDPAHKTRNA
ncbi:MAG: proton-conducting transporter membrane subunit [Pseudomonadota bacterium]